ncbi:7999_t:CDS:2 [Funneliformis caledonium]|uniref:7999_t:CDS:1 n=1 Tax=Funneliformis caledonium TaxID=1117310 RepID=A0A9N9HRT1_9GLOM|nr:7999_t:CDS:2 [Funneliformis caledonium]
MFLEYTNSDFFIFQEHYNATVKGGIKGAAIGLGLTLGLSLIAQRYFPTFRNSTIQLKAFLVSSGTTAGCIILAEQAEILFQKIDIVFLVLLGL